jgi:hypothetical protein
LFIKLFFSLNKIYLILSHIFFLHLHSINLIYPKTNYSKNLIIPIFNFLILSKFISQNLTTPLNKKPINFIIITNSIFNFNFENIVSDYYYFNSKIIPNLYYFNKYDYFNYLFD